MAKLASKLLFGPLPTDKLEGINVPRMREERAAKAKAEMRKQGIPTLLVDGGPNVRYLTGYACAEFMPGLAYCLFFAEHDPIMFEHAGNYHQMQDQAPWIKHWRIAHTWFGGLCGPENAQYEAKRWAQEIHQELKDHGLVAEKAGIVGFDLLAREALKGAGVKVVEAWPLLLDASKTKTVDEINCFKMAASCCTSGWDALVRGVRPGMTNFQAGGLISKAIAEAGAEMPGGMVSSGPQTFPRNVFMTNRRIDYGDSLFAFLCGTLYMGYGTCLYRTAICGRRPNDKEKDMHKRLIDSLDACIDATRAGNTTADAAKHIPPASDFGYKDEAEVFTIQFGHGLGLVSLISGNIHYNLPIITREWSLRHPEPFEKGMVMAYELIVGDEYRGNGVRSESMVVITDNGPEIIEHIPRNELLGVGL